MDHEEISAYAAVVAAGIAAVALVIAAYQIRVTRLETRRTTAHQIYKDYLRLAMDHPEFSLASFPMESPRLQEILKDDLKYEQYEFYVAQLLFAVEGILETCADAEWEATLTDQLSYHALYLQGEHLRQRHYSQRVLSLCDAAIAEYASLR